MHRFYVDMQACCKFADTSDWFRFPSELEWFEEIDLHTSPEGVKGGREAVG
jgi:hypothetical protein